MGTKRGYHLHCCMPRRAMSNETSGSYWASGPSLSDLDASSLPHKPEMRTSRVRRSLDRSAALERSTGDDAGVAQMQQSAAAAPMHGAHGVPAQSCTVSDIPQSFPAASAMDWQPARTTQSGQSCRLAWQLVSILVFFFHGVVDAACMRLRFPSACSSHEGRLCVMVRRHRMAQPALTGAGQAAQGKDLLPLHKRRRMAP